MKYLELDTLKVLDLQQLRLLKNNISFSAEPSDEELRPLGYAVIHPTDKPEGDVVTEGPPQAIGNKWYQSWNVREFNEEELLQKLEKAKSDKKLEILNKFKDHLEEGMAYDFEGVTDYVQIRDQDKSNLLALFIESGIILTELKSLDDSGTEYNINDYLMEFRPKSNNTKYLIPKDMRDLCIKSLMYSKKVYSTKWHLDDKLLTLTSIDEVKSLKWEMV